FEFLAEALEQLNVFGLFTRELQQRAHAIIVAPELRPRVVQHERQYELFDKTEDAEIGVASDLIQRPPLFAVEKRKLLDARERFRHEMSVEVEPFFSPDNVFNAPVNDFCRRERRLVGISVKHVWEHLLQVPNR